MEIQGIISVTIMVTTIPIAIFLVLRKKTVKTGISRIGYVGRHALTMLCMAVILISATLSAETETVPWMTQDNSSAILIAMAFWHVFPLTILNIRRLQTLGRSRLWALSGVIPLFSLFLPFLFLCFMKTPKEKEEQKIKITRKFGGLGEDLAARENLAATDI